jgi:CBS domain-containing protein
MRVEDICTHVVTRINATAPLTEAAALMRESNVGTVVVVEGSNGERSPIGMLTDRDIVVSVLAAGLSMDTLTVGDVMSKPVYCCSGSQDVFDAIAIMREHGIRRLPVLNIQGSLAGIIAADDIWTALAIQLSSLGEAMTREHVREMSRRT